MIRSPASYRTAGRVLPRQTRWEPFQLHRVGRLLLIETDTNLNVDIPFISTSEVIFPAEFQGSGSIEFAPDFLDPTSEVFAPSFSQDVDIDFIDGSVNNFVGIHEFALAVDIPFITSTSEFVGTHEFVGPRAIDVDFISNASTVFTPTFEDAGGFYVSTNRDIRQRMIDLGLGVPIIYDNAPMCVEPTPDQWIRWTLPGGTETQVTLGGSNSTFRYNGVAIAQIFTRINLGTAKAMTLADTISNQFRGITTSFGIVWLAPDVTVVGRDGRWWQVNVTLPFYTDFPRLKNIPEATTSVSAPVDPPTTVIPTIGATYVQDFPGPIGDDVICAIAGFRGQTSKELSLRVSALNSGTQELTTSSTKQRQTITVNTSSPGDRMGLSLQKSHPSSRMSRAVSGFLKRPHTVTTSMTTTDTSAQL